MADAVAADEVSKVVGLLSASFFGLGLLLFLIFLLFLFLSNGVRLLRLTINLEI